MIAWLCTILCNGFINGRRKRRLEVPDPDGIHAVALAEQAEQDDRLGLKDGQAATVSRRPIAVR
ncbi:hypothetical protein [Methylobacterium sp. P5_C11]